MIWRSKSAGKQPESGVLQPHPVGLKVVHEGPTPIVDIVAIHGLDGHREETWTASNGQNWLRDFIPNDDEISKSRVLSWGYDSRTRAPNPISQNRLFEHANQLIQDLSDEREDTGNQNQPILFIAHSLGGIVLMEALLKANLCNPNHLERHALVKKSTHGILFFGTPHQGTDVTSLGQIMLNVAKLATNTNDTLVENIRLHSAELIRLLDSFASIRRDFMITCFYEELETELFPKGSKRLIVPKFSAAIPGRVNEETVGLYANHSDTVRYESKDDPSYAKVRRNIRRQIREIPRRLQAMEGVAQQIQQTRHFSKRFHVASPEPQTSLRGRDEDVKYVHDHLNVKDKRRILVLSGLGGMGKTHLARHYAYKHKEHYTARLWMDAHDETRLHTSFRAAAQEIRERYEGDSSIDYVHRAVEGNDQEKIVRAVQRWLKQPENTDWLMIFDNYDQPKSSRRQETHTDSSDANRNHGELATLDDHPQERQSSTDVSEPFDIEPFLPESDHGAILVTTRMTRLDFSEDTHQLRPLRHGDESLAILEDRSGVASLKLDDGAAAVAKKLDGFPLALASAGSYKKQHPSTSWSHYLELYDKQWKTMAKWEVKGHYDRTLYSTWAVSYASVEKKNRGAAELLRLWAYFHHGDLWYGLLRPDKSDYEKLPGGLALALPEWYDAFTSDFENMHEAFNTLCEYGFATSIPPSTLCEPNQSNPPGYSIHGCVHAWSKHVLNRKDETEDMERSHLAQRLCGCAIPAPELPNFDILCYRLEPHAEEVWRLRYGQTRPQHGQALLDTQIAFYFLAVRNDNRHEYFLLQSLQAVSSKPGSTIHDTYPYEGDDLVVVTANLAESWLRQNKPIAAARLSRSVVEVTRDDARISTPTQLSIKLMLAQALIPQDATEEAEAILVELTDELTDLISSQPVPGVGQTWIQGIIEIMAKLLVDSGRNTEAVELLEHAIKASEGIITRPTTAQFYTTLGTLYYKSNPKQTRKAREVFEWVLSTFETIDDLDKTDLWHYHVASVYFHRCFKKESSGPEDRKTAELILLSFRRIRAKIIRTPGQANVIVFHTWLCEGELLLHLEEFASAYEALSNAITEYDLFEADDKPIEEADFLFLLSQFAEACHVLGKYNEENEIRKRIAALQNRSGADIQGQSEDKDTVSYNRMGESDDASATQMVLRGRRQDGAQATPSEPGGEPCGGPSTTSDTRQKKKRMAPFKFLTRWQRKAG